MSIRIFFTLILQEEEETMGTAAFLNASGTQDILTRCS